MHLISRSGSPQDVEAAVLLLDHGADINAIDKARTHAKLLCLSLFVFSYFQDGNSVLLKHIRYTTSHDLPMVKLFVERGVDLTQRNKVPSAQVLIGEYTAKTFVLLQFGHSAVLEACRMKKFQIAMFLVENGADPAEALTYAADRNNVVANLEVRHNSCN